MTNRHWPGKRPGLGTATALPAIGTAPASGASKADNFGMQYTCCSLHVASSARWQRQLTPLQALFARQSGHGDNYLACGDCPHC